MAQPGVHVARPLVQRLMYSRVSRRAGGAALTPPSLAGSSGAGTCQLLDFAIGRGRPSQCRVWFLLHPLPRAALHPCCSQPPIFPEKSHLAEIMRLQTASTGLGESSRHFGDVRQSLIPFFPRGLRWRVQGHMEIAQQAQAGHHRPMPHAHTSGRRCQAENKRTGSATPP